MEALILLNLKVSRFSHNGTTVGININATSTFSKLSTGEYKTDGLVGNASTDKPFNGVIPVDGTAKVLLGISADQIELRLSKISFKFVVVSNQTHAVDYDGKKYVGIVYEKGGKTMLELGLNLMVVIDVNSVTIDQLIEGVYNDDTTKSRLKSIKSNPLIVAALKTKLNELATASLTSYNLALKAVK